MYIYIYIEREREREMSPMDEPYRRLKKFPESQPKVCVCAYITNSRRVEDFSILHYPIKPHALRGRGRSDSIQKNCVCLCACVAFLACVPVLPVWPVWPVSPWPLLAGMVRDPLLGTLYSLSLFYLCVIVFHYFCERGPRLRALGRAGPCAATG